jgi:penicillin-binding protein 1A
VLLFFVSLITISGLYLLIFLQDRNKQIPTPDKVFPDIHLATEIYDRNGERLYRLFGDYSNSDKVDIAEINDTVKAAFLAAEDSEFYNHNGVDLQAITRCVVTIAKNEGFCGGSTITQQLIKITTEQKERTFQTKIDEILLALKVEQQFSKDQILEMYMRVTPYGSNITSIKAASRFYFGINDLKQLNLAQATVLAAIINNPSNLSPTLSLDNEAAQIRLKDRQNYVLDQLSEKLDQINEQLAKNNPEFKPLTQEMIDEARATEVKYQPPIITDIKAGHFVNYALNKLQMKNYKNGVEPFTINDLKTGGYKIYTSLDYWSQTVAEKFVWQAGNQYKDLNMNNAAVMTTVPSTGEIITMAGSKSFYTESEGCDGSGQNCKFDPQVNIFTSPRSPGSTNKSLGYYIGFRDQKISPYSYIFDGPTKFGDYSPKNWDGSFIGSNSAYNMLRLSRNIPAIKVMEMIGVGNYLDTARQFGYTTYTNNDNYGLSAILGGAEIYYEEHAQAYGVFANLGDFVELNPILKIEDKNGNIIYQANPQRVGVADRGAVSKLNQVLYRLDTFGAPTYWDDRDMAAKTGTTEENKDALVVIYSPDFVTIAWGGNNNNEIMNQYYGWPGTLVIPWTRDYMNELNWGGRFTQKTPFSW